MMHYCFSIYDNAVNTYGAPWTMKTTAEAVRAFRNMAEDNQTTVGRNPTDFRLYLVGMWDDNECEFVPQERESLGWAHELIGEKDNG